MPAKAIKGIGEVNSKRFAFLHVRGIRRKHFREIKSAQEQASLLWALYYFALFASHYSRRLLNNGSYTAGTNGSTTLTVLRIVNRHETCCFYVIYVAYIAHVAQKINGLEFF